MFYKNKQKTKCINRYKHNSHSLKEETKQKKILWQKRSNQNIIKKLKINAIDVIQKLKSIDWNQI